MLAMVVSEDGISGSIVFVCFTSSCYKELIYFLESELFSFT